MPADEEIYYTDADGNCENCGGEGEIMQLDGSVHACYPCRLQAARATPTTEHAETAAIRDARSLALGFRAGGNVLVAQIIENCISEACTLRAERDARPEITPEDAAAWIASMPNFYMPIPEQRRVHDALRAHAGKVAR